MKPVVDLPLAAASIRLRGKPGRPRKRPIEAPAPPSNAPPTGTARAQDTTKPHTNGGSGDRRLASPASAPIGPRLLDLRAAANYLSVAPWTLRELEWAGVLSRVRVPLANGGELRKVLFDRADLDALIEHAKDHPAGAEISPLAGGGASTRTAARRCAEAVEKGAG